MTDMTVAELAQIARDAAPAPIRIGRYDVQYVGEYEYVHETKEDR